MKKIIQVLYLSTLMSSLLSTSVFAQDVKHPLDIMGEENFQKMQKMDKSFHLYPDYPSMLFVGKSIGDSVTLTPNDNFTEHMAQVVDMKSSTAIVPNNADYDEATNTYQLIKKYKEQYPESGLVVGGLIGATSSYIKDKDGDYSKKQKSVNMNNTASVTSLIGLMVGTFVGNHQYEKELANSMKNNYHLVNTTIIQFKLKNGEVGRFSQTNLNLLRNGNWKIGDNIRFYKENHIWKFERQKT